MPSDSLFTGVSQLASPGGYGALRGAQMRDLQITPAAAIAVSNGQIDWVGPRTEWTGSAQQEIDLGGRAVVPGLVDPHTHAIWAGDRLADFEARSSGVSYEKILAGGGGIRSTIRQPPASRPMSSSPSPCRVCRHCSGAAPPPSK